ncbi:unnamed protein product [Adineta steineri]|uniref:RRM domain-containing protein n=1 Tax=Adineta steineri TaxID=433720 RepID=A0A814PJJ0_9BILA|nr:unnamed protein product [Adineta steineri]
MSSISSQRLRYSPKYTEICVGNISNHTEPFALLKHFEQFGTIMHYNFTSPTGGYVFITYEDSSMVDKCMSSRPHHLDDRHLYVKRALPVDDEHPRERFDTTRDLMIVIDFKNDNYNNEQFLTKLREYFSTYERVYACKFCHETNFDYILVEFGDKDAVDRIILDKPHFYNDQRLDVMKFLPSNIEIMNSKYASKKPSKSVIKDAIDDDDHDFSASRKSSGKQNPTAKEPISETDLQNEVYRLQNALKKMNEEYAAKRRQLEEECCERLKQLNENADKTQSLQQDLEQEHAKLLVEYESMKHENDTLNEQYLTAELENFEITSYYEQILAEEKAKTAQLQADYEQKSATLNTNNSFRSTPSPQLNNTSSSATQSPSQSTVPNDN